MLRALLFDKDGTLVDFQATWGRAAVAVIRDFAAGDAALRSRLVDLAGLDPQTATIRAGSPLIAGSSADYGADWAAVLGAEPGRAFERRLDEAFAAAARDTLAEIAGSARVLAELAPLYRLGMLTNDSEAAALAQCERLGLMPHLAAVIGYDSGHGRKPSPDPVHAFARRIGVAAHEIAVIGDSIHDLEAARAAGAVAVAVLSGPASRADLASHADWIVDDVTALPSLLRELA